MSSTVGSTIKVPKNARSAELANRVNDLMRQSRALMLSLENIRGETAVPVDEPKLVQTKVRPVCPCMISLMMVGRH